MGSALYTIQPLLGKVLFTKLKVIPLGRIAAAPGLGGQVWKRASSHRKSRWRKVEVHVNQQDRPGIGWRKLVWAEGCSLYCVSPNAGQKIVLTRQLPIAVRRSPARGNRVKQSRFLSINRRLLRWPSQTAPLTTCHISIVQVSFRYSSQPVWTWTLSDEVWPGKGVRVDTSSKLGKHPRCPILLLCKGGLPPHCASLLYGYRPSVLRWHTEVIDLTYAQCNNTSSREASLLSYLPPKKVFFTQHKVSTPSLQLLSVSPGPSDSSWGVVRWTNVDVEGLLLSSRPVCVHKDRRRASVGLWPLCFNIGRPLLKGAVLWGWYPNTA